MYEPASEAKWSGVDLSSSSALMLDLWFNKNIVESSEPEQNKNSIYYAHNKLYW